MKLDRKQFDWFKGQIKEDTQEHEIKLMNALKPQETIDMYEGKIGEASVWENYLFIAMQTILPTMFYQVPRPTIKPTISAYAYSASVIEGLLKHYFNDDVKEENQLCILDALLPYGFGVMKVGYNSRVGYVKLKSNIFTGTAGKSNSQGLEENCEYIRFERPILTRCSPKDTLLDASKPFGKGKHITFNYDRNLKELRESNLYELQANFINYFKSRNDDETQIKFKLHEHWREEFGGVFKVVYVDEWDEPLFYERTEYKELPIALLRFNKTPDQLYASAHGTHAARAQKELQYLNELQKQHIDKTRRQHLVYMDSISEPGKVTLKSNEIDGIVECLKPVTAGVVATIGTNPMSGDVYSNIETTRNYLKLLLTISGGRAGQSDVEFATTEQAQAQGDMMRMSGMQDAIRDFVRKQERMTVSNIYRFGNPELVIKITGKDITDPVTGEPITGRELMIGGETGLTLQNEIQGDVESDYLYDVDMASASRPDFAVMRKQMGEFMAVVTNPVIEQKLLQKGKEIDTSEIVKDYANMFDNISNPDKYIVDLKPEQIQAMQGQAMLQGAMQSSGLMPKNNGSVPTEKAINVGANQVTI